MIEHPCNCCGEGEGVCGDPHLGPVCGECYALLVNVRFILNTIGSRLGIGVCAEPRRTEDR